MAAWFPRALVPMTERWLLTLCVPLFFWYGATRPAPSPLGPPVVRVIRVEHPVSARLSAASERISTTSHRVTVLDERLSAIADALRCNLLYLAGTVGKTRAIKGQGQRRYRRPGKRAEIARTGSRGVPAATTWPGYASPWVRSDRCTDGY